MLAVAFAVGFRIEGTLAEAVVATLLLFASLRLQLDPGAHRPVGGSVEAANSAGFIWMFPLTFMSSAFVAPRPCRAGSQPIAEPTPSRASPTPPGPSTTAATRATTCGSRIAWAVGITVVFGLAGNPAKFVSDLHQVTRGPRPVSPIADCSPPRSAEDEGPVLRTPRGSSSCREGLALHVPVGSPRSGEDHSPDSLTDCRPTRWRVWPS